MIIVSIVGPTMKDALVQIAASRRSADLYEFRLDLIQRPDLIGLLSSVRKPSVVSCRSKNEGGGFSGSARERTMLLELGRAFGAAYVDLEYSTDRPLLQRFLGATHPSGVILSAHFPGSVPSGINALFHKMKGTGADVLKIAYGAEDAADVRSAIEFLSLCHRKKQEGIAIAMGEAGESSRILYRKLGGWATYASSETGPPAAPGQLPANVLRRIYRAHLLNRDTKVFGVIGMPLGQSKGVFLHNPLFERARMNAVYCRFPTRNLAAFMKGVAPLLSGFSVTIPHKESIMKYLRSAEADARASGTVNTVVRRGDGLFGINTDGPAALDAIEAVVSVKGRRILILGAGGAARAIAYEALKRGGEVMIANRTERKARMVARDLHLTAIPFRRIRSAHFDLLVNATPVGMTPDVESSPVPGSILRGRTVFDAVYNPSETKLLRDAKDEGATPISGAGMYLNQALRQSEIYTGVRPGRKFALKQLGFDGS